MADFFRGQIKTVQLFVCSPYQMPTQFPTIRSNTSNGRKRPFQWVEALLLMDGNHIVVNFIILRIYKIRKYVRIFVYIRII
jgi:hypothetical protein